MSPKSMKELRRRFKLTQRAAAALVPVSPNTWARWERGEAKPRGLHQRKMVALLPHLMDVNPPGSVESVGGDRSHDGVQPNLGDRDLPPYSSARALLKYAGTWMGSDLERCLGEVYAWRGLAKF
jgi:DNA-binding XRE family transcriptional regulator